MTDPIVEAAEKKKAQHEAEKAQYEAEKAKLEAQLALKALETDETDKAIKAAEAEKAVAEAKKAALDAEKARIEAARALAASKLVDPVAEATKDAEAQKKLIEAQKGVTDAQQQAWLAKYIGGEVKPGPYTGKVTMDDKAGDAEATLLAIKALRGCAKKVAADIREEIAEASYVYVYDAAKPPTFERVMNYRLRYDLIHDAFTSALPAAQAAPVAAAMAVTPAMIAAGLSAAHSILGFFKTNWSFRGVEVKLENTLAVQVVAGAIERKSERQVHAPSLYQPPAEQAVKALTDELGALVDLRARATAALAQLDDEDAKKRVQAAIDLHDSFFTHLTTTDANGTSPLVAIASEKALRDTMGGAMVLLVRVETSGGTHFDKEGLFAGVGNAPLFFSGGTALSYILFEGETGKVRAADVVVEYTDKVKVSELRESLEAD